MIFKGLKICFINQKFYLSRALTKFDGRKLKEWGVANGFSNQMLQLPRLVTQVTSVTQAARSRRIYTTIKILFCLVLLTFLRKKTSKEKNFSMKTPLEEGLFSLRWIFLNQKLGFVCLLCIITLFMKKPYQSKSKPIFFPTQME